jgi:DNA-binding PadR family transcriptional regulator
VLILTSLADGPKHGYALLKDIEAFACVTLGPGTLYGALARLESRGLVRPLEADDRRHPYELTEDGASELRLRLADMRTVANVGLTRLAVS